MNGKLGKDMLRVAKRIIARAKKIGGRPSCERITLRKGWALTSDGKVAIVVRGTGCNDSGYLEFKPKGLGTGAAIEFGANGAGIKVKQGEQFTQHEIVDDKLTAQIESGYPDLFKPYDASKYHDPIYVDPQAMIDALDVFFKKQHPDGALPRVMISMPKGGRADAPVLFSGLVDDGDGTPNHDGAAFVAPMTVQE